MLLTSLFPVTLLTPFSITPILPHLLLPPSLRPPSFPPTSPLLRKLLPSCRLIGIDLAPRMLEIASKRLGCYDTLIQTDAAGIC